MERTYEARTELRGPLLTGEPGDILREAVLRLLKLTEDGEPVPTLAVLRADLLLVGAADVVDAVEAGDSRTQGLWEVAVLAYGDGEDPDPLESAVAVATGEFVPLTGNLALLTELTGSTAQRALLLLELLEVAGCAVAFAPAELAEGLLPHAVLGDWAVWHASLRVTGLEALARSGG